MSATCWSVLQLDRGSDERSLKRQYAALLKVTRPDDDPAAFQRLREAYEEALLHIRAQVSRDEDDERVPETVLEYEADGQVGPSPTGFDAPSQVAAAAPEVGQRHELLLQELFAQLTLHTLDTCLNIARERGCEVAFEQRLLALCLSTHPDAESITEWALVMFDWLRPWQPTPLPRQQMQGLAERLVQWKLALLNQLLAAGQEDAALAHLDVLLDSAWLQSLDRREWVQRHLLGWLSTSPDWSLDFFRAFCTRLDLQPDDYQTQQSPVWRALQQRYEEQSLLQTLRKQLAQKTPEFVEDQAAWLLLKGQGAGRRRHLIDQMGPTAWQACGQLDNALRRHPQVLGKLGLKQLPDWRQWLPSAPDSLWGWWVLLLCFVTMQALDVRNMLGIDLAIAFSAPVLAGNLWAAVVGLLVFYGGQSVWERVSRFLAMPDGWLSNLLMPRVLARDGAGFLLIRHLIPCLILGASAGLWVKSTFEHAWLYGALVTGLALAYRLFRLGIIGVRVGSWLASWSLSDRWRKIAHFGGMIFVVVFAFAGADNTHSGCEKAPRGRLAYCLKFGQQVPEKPVWLRARPPHVDTKPSFQLGETLTPESQMLPEEALPPISPPKKTELKYK